MMNTDDARHDGPSEVFPWLFLGTIQQAYNLNKKYQGFCRVVNCVGGSAPSKEYLKNLFKNVQNKQPGDIPQHYYKMCVLDDFGKSDLTSKKVDEALDFLEQASKREEKTLVHCRQGINRSTTLVVLYLMKKENMTLREALSFITKKRSQGKNFHERSICFQREEQLGRMMDI